MKRIVYFLFYLTITVFSFANDMITNSEIVLYCNDSGKDIHYIKGDIFNEIDIAEIRFYLVTDDELIDLRNYIKKYEKIETSNSLLLAYEYQKIKINIEIYPNKRERERLNFFIKGENFNNKTKFIVEIVPQSENKYIDYLDNGVYKYDNLYFGGEKFKGECFIAKEEEFKNFITRGIKLREKVGVIDNLYYIYSEVGNDKKSFDEIFTIYFYNYDKKKSSEIQNTEVNLFKNRVANKQLEDLFLCVDRRMIPDVINYKKSKEDYSVKPKLFYYNLLYNKNFEKNRIFEDSNLKKDDNEALVYYTLLFKYLNEKNLFLSEDYTQKKVVPEVLSLLDLVELIEDEIIYIQDNIEVYYWYFELIDAIENREEFFQDREFILEKKKLLTRYVRENYLTKNGVKTRKIYEEIDARNIGYINFISLDEQKKIVENDYKRYYDERLGILKIDSTNEIDVKYNLNFIIALYRIGEYQKANQLFLTLENYIQKNGNYLVSKIKLDGESNFGIEGELLYLYILALTYREN